MGLAGLVSTLAWPWAGPLTTCTVAGLNGWLLDESFSSTCTVTGLVPSVSAKSGRVIILVVLGTVRSSRNSTAGRCFRVGVVFRRGLRLERSARARAKDDQ